MAKVIIYENEFGNVTVCMPTGEVPINEVLNRDCPPGAIVVDDSILPNDDDDFFNAWELNGKTVTVNIEKAKEITKSRLRNEREPLLQIQDILFQKCLENGSDFSEIVAEKNRLRNITDNVTFCKTTKELRAISVIG